MHVRLKMQGKIFVFVFVLGKSGIFCFAHMESFLLIFFFYYLFIENWREYQCQLLSVKHAWVLPMFPTYMRYSIHFVLCQPLHVFESQMAYFISCGESMSSATLLMLRRQFRVWIECYCGQPYKIYTESKYCGSIYVSKWPQCSSRTKTKKRWPNAYL